MNKWTKSSMELVYKEGYLDNLLEIYPIKSNPKREISDELKDNIENSFNSGDYKELLILLIKALKRKEIKFPIDCSYTASFKKEPDWLDTNPKTVQTMGGLLNNLGIKKILKKIAAPKSSSRQSGPMFNTWFNNKFEADKEINSLGTSDSERKQKAKDLIDYDSEKGLDVFIQINNIYILGEARFLSEEGDAQWRSLETAFYIFDSFKKKSNVLPIVIIDGVCYRKSGTKFYRKITKAKDEYIIISALLLNEFFEKVKNLKFDKKEIPNNDIISLIS